MNLKPKLAVSLLLAASASMAQATTYNVSAVFTDGGMQGVTVFDGSFDWDGNTVSNFTGLLSESMWGWNTNQNGFTGRGMKGGMAVPATYLDNVYAQPGGYGANDAPLLNLTHQLAGGTVDPNTGLVTVTTFLQNSTDVVWGGGYDVKAMTVESVNIGGIAYGAKIFPSDPSTWDGNVRNNNGFFTLVFDPSDPTNTVATLDQIVYGDYTALGMMAPMLTGPVGMSGWSNGGVAGGTMGGMPFSLTITAAVPVPVASWLFGGALLTLLGARRKSGRAMAFA